MKHKPTEMEYHKSYGVNTPWNGSVDFHTDEEGVSKKDSIVVSWSTEKQNESCLQPLKECF